MTAAGTYLDESDLGKIGGAIAEPTLRLYGPGDTWKKIRSSAGLQLVLGALATFATAAVGLALALTAASPESSVDVSKAKSVLAWTRAPLDQLKASPAPTVSELDAFRRTVDARITTGSDFVALLQGDEAPAATVPGVTCKASSGSGWSAQTVGGVITAVIGVLTAVLGFLALTSKYGFQQSPS